ncbi:hypothetical protein EVAR_69373_1 [Eumeta japonica]|uniref:Uncharacterized protein n=1 Tax=Eumeta variegata TaxID=151549 RepID=A0A4C1ZY17_EUMVA|nr:hypothetical protein EVAR_69373_1 [Eumeta japonica]
MELKLLGSCFQENFTPPVPDFISALMGTVIMFPTLAGPACRAKRVRNDKDINLTNKVFFSLFRRGEVKAYILHDRSPLHTRSIGLKPTAKFLLKKFRLCCQLLQYATGQHARVLRDVIFPMGDSLCESFRHRLEEVTETPVTGPLSIFRRGNVSVNDE